MVSDELEIEEIRPRQQLSRREQNKYIQTLFDNIDGEALTKVYKQAFEFARETGRQVVVQGAVIHVEEIKQGGIRKKVSRSMDIQMPHRRL